jgi:pyrroline-5-carboxylate reductase
MGGAILYGALESGVLPKENAYVYDINPEMMEKASSWGVNLCTDDEDVCAKSDIILLAVKPQNAAEALGMCNKALDGKAMMSIVAGVTVERLQNMIDGSPRILRLLPNTPAMVFEGAFAVCSDNDFTEEELKIAKAIYSSIGIIEMVPEKLIDAGTAISGCGPAFCFMFADALADGGVLAGIPKDKALSLAIQTLLGSARLMAETGISPSVLKDKVTSPGGSTIEGVKALEEGAFRATVINAASASYEKTKKLGK